MRYPYEELLKISHASSQEASLMLSVLPPPIAIEGRAQDSSCKLAMVPRGKYEFVDTDKEDWNA